MLCLCDCMFDETASGSFVDDESSLVERSG